jgi:hypothetical protein
VNMVRVPKVLASSFRMNGNLRPGVHNMTSEILLEGKRKKTALQAGPKQEISTEAFSFPLRSG